MEIFYKLIQFFSKIDVLQYLTNKWLLIQSLDREHFLLAILSILPWGFTVYYLQPGKPLKKLFISLFALLVGILSTEIILSLHPIFWPEINFKPRRSSILSQTVHIAFIQAGMMEETFKVLGILALSYVIAFNKSLKQWTKEVILVGAFVALGFSLVENYVYIHKDSSKAIVFNMFMGRTIFSSNIHLLINLCFALFIYKTNFKETLREKILLVVYAFLLAVIQHGIVDFFLLPSSKFGIWLATAFFSGIWVWVARDLRKFIYIYEKNILEPVQNNVKETHELNKSSLATEYNGHEEELVFNKISETQKILDSTSQSENK